MDLGNHIDFIGDIHGHADELKLLLEKMGYSHNGQAYMHPSRQVVFIGDYIDRGPKIKESLEIVKAMVDADCAIALMGNHEFNAICFNEENRDGNFIREHSPKNEEQHAKTQNEFKNDRDTYNMYIDWFKTLPLFLETDTFRAVHACWDEKSIEKIRVELETKSRSETLVEAMHGKSDVYMAIEKILKGVEISLPHGETFKDKSDHVRTEIRTKWWKNPIDANFNSISVEPLHDIETTEEHLKLIQQLDFYTHEKPVFFGHYWLRSSNEEGKLLLRKTNVCCLDYSVAKDGQLVAYRFDGAQALEDAKFVSV